MTQPDIQTFYVSLTRDLLGHYLAIAADSEATVRKYLAHEYFRNGEWKLPWCTVYTKQKLERDDTGDAIQARCGTLYAYMFD